MTTGEPGSLHAYLHHKDGHRVPVNIRATQIANNGEVLGSVETFTDNSRVHKLNEDIEQLKTIALYDQLTELPNRRYLDTYLDSKYTEFTVLDMPFAVIYTDIDFFKKVNDTYGHSIGDQVLKMVAKTLSGCLRNSDIVARYGGEEFVIVAPIAELDNAKTLAEKLRRLIETSELRNETDLIKVTMSFGVTLIQDGDSLDDVLNRADGLLYQAKENGRNRVVCG
jgi:diguanylate cyclase (GGDEF)-like protein